MFYFLTDEWKSTITSVLHCWSHDTSTACSSCNSSSFVMFTDPQYQYKMCYYQKKGAEKHLKTKFPEWSPWCHYYCVFRSSYGNFHYLRISASWINDNFEIKGTNEESPCSTKKSSKSIRFEHHRCWKRWKGKAAKNPTKWYSPNPSRSKNSTGVYDSENFHSQTVLPTIPPPASLAETVIFLKVQICTIIQLPLVLMLMNQQMLIFKAVTIIYGTNLIQYYL